jgi:hypothetical protein
MPRFLLAGVNVKSAHRFGVNEPRERTDRTAAFGDFRIRVISSNPSISGIPRSTTSLWLHPLMPIPHARPHLAGSIVSARLSPAV